MGDLVNRRNAMKSVGLMGVALAATPGPAAELAAADAYKPSLGLPRGVGTGVVSPDSIVGQLSDDKIVTTVRFGKNLDDLTLDLASTEAFSLTKVATVEIPVVVPQTANDESVEFFGYLTVVRGSITKDTGTRVVVMLDLGGTTHVLEYTFGEARDDEIGERYFGFLPAAIEVVVTQEKVLEKGKEIVRDVRTTVYRPAPPIFSGVLTVTVQRRAADAKASIEIREMEVQVIQPKPPSNGDPSPKKADPKRRYATPKKP